MRNSQLIQCRLDLHSLKSLLFRALAALLFLAAVCAPLQAQQDPREKAEQAVERAIEAMGGQSYKNVEVVYRHGNYFRFDRHGRRSPLIKYWEWLHYQPLKWFFQIGKGNRQQVSVYNLEINKGWKKEGKGYIEDVDQEDIEGFAKQARHDPDVVIRLRSGLESLQLFYYGPDEVSGGGNFEAVEFLDETNDSVVIYFDLDTHLPSRLEYKQTDRLGNRRQFSEEYFNWHEFKGVQHPLRIDSYMEGQLLEQRHMTEVEINPVVPPGQFLEPPIKKKK